MLIPDTDVVLKAPQRRDIPNYGLSMHHDLETCVTTALLYGADIQVCAADNKHPVPAPAIHTLLEKIQDENEATRFEKAEREFYSYFWTEEKHNECGRRPGLLSLIESSISTLQHPLALPCAILEDHMRATHESCEHGEVHAETWKIMNRLKMRGDDGNPRLFWIQAMGLNEFKPKGAEDTPKAGDPSFDPKTLTARIDRQILRIMFTERCPEWNRDCSLFILDLAKELNDRKPEQELFESDKHEILQGGLEQNMSISKALTCLLEVMKENLNLQLNVCASISAQVNNEYNLVTNENNLKLQKTTADLTETSTEIARHTSHDSTSMKILAVITALFLPGTFVASLLALNVFDGLWQEKGTGYSHLWIYFVIDIPLTLITMAGWARWWEFELHLRDNKKSYRDVWNALRKRKSPRRSESISLRRLDGSTQSGGSTEQLSHADSRAVAGPPLDLEQGREV